MNSPMTCIPERLASPVSFSKSHFHQWRYLSACGCASPEAEERIVQDAWQASPQRIYEATDYRRLPPTPKRCSRNTMNTSFGMDKPRSQNLRGLLFRNSL